MNKEKQIEEMAKILCGRKNGCDECMFNKVHCYERNDAEALYNAGYRKASEVAMEIFEEIESKLTEETKDILERINRITDPDAVDGLYEEVATLEDVLTLLAELKKKYTEKV